MAKYEYVYHMRNLSKTYAGNKRVLEDINLQFLPDAKIGVLGVNGAGKSTILRIMAGLDKDFTGESWPAKGAKIGYLPQDPKLNDEITVLENITLGVQEKKELLNKYTDISLKLAEDYSEDLLDQMTQMQDTIDAQNLWDLDSRISMAMDALKCPAPDTDVKTLSGGEIRRVALCQLLLSEPDLLLLDEPTNHLDASTIAWLEQHLREFKGAILMVTHDRYFLDNVTNWILEISSGRGIPYQGNYSSWLEQRQKRLKQAGKEDAARQKAIAREQEWISSSPSARRGKSKARISKYEELLARSNSLAVTTSQITITVAQRLGVNVIQCDGISKGYGDRLLLDNLTFKLPPGGIVGVIGPNGAGKTTLFKLLAGQEKPDCGTISIGDSVILAYVDQSRDSLNPNNTVWEEISEKNDVLYLGKREVNSRAYCASFNFKGSDQQKKVNALSGGEINRVHMAKILKSGANVLLLDEPTNDLDVETLRALEEALEEFPGCAVIISHDRWFLDRISTHILAFEGDGHVEWFEGNFQDYLADKVRRLGDNVKTENTKWRPLTR